MPCAIAQLGFARASNAEFALETALYVKMSPPHPPHTQEMRTRDLRQRNRQGINFVRGLNLDSVYICRRELFHVTMRQKPWVSWYNFMIRSRTQLQSYKILKSCSHFYAFKICNTFIHLEFVTFNFDGCNLVICRTISLKLSCNPYFIAANERSLEIYCLFLNCSNECIQSPQ